MKATIAAMAAKDPMLGPNSSIAMTEAASGALARARLHRHHPDGRERSLVQPHNVRGGAAGGGPDD